MTREEAIEVIKRTKGAMVYTKKEKEALETLIPELIETEDERIRKWLCNYFSSIDEAWIHKDITCIDILRWLEKQKEQKPAEWSDEDEKYLNRVINLWVNDFGEDSDTVKWLKSLRPSWKPSEDEVRLINTSISFLKDFADKGYENAVECIDWLKSKLNGNSCK